MRRSRKPKRRGRVPWISAVVPPAVPEPPAAGWAGWGLSAAPRRRGACLLRRPQPGGGGAGGGVPGAVLAGSEPAVVALTAGGAAGMALPPGIALFLGRRAVLIGAA